MSLADCYYITVDDTTRIVHPSTNWLHAMADVLNQLGHRASHTPSTCTIHFKRDEAEIGAAIKLLDEVAAVKGGTSIVYLRQGI